MQFSSLEYSKRQTGEILKSFTIIYEEHIVVFVIAISDKKDQQRVINAIKHLIPFYKEEIKKKLGL